MRSVLLTYEGPAGLIAPLLTAGAAVAGVVTARKQAKQAESAAAEQRKAIEKQEGIQAKADKKVAEQTAREEAKTTERRARLATGRGGLLFEGKQTGVDEKDVLGG